MPRTAQQFSILESSANLSQGLTLSRGATNETEEVSSSLSSQTGAGGPGQDLPFILPQSPLCKVEAVTTSPRAYVSIRRGDSEVT